MEEGLTAVVMASLSRNQKANSGCGLRLTAVKQHDLYSTFKKNTQTTSSYTHGTFCGAGIYQVGFLWPHRNHNLNVSNEFDKYN